MISRFQAFLRFVKKLKPVGPYKPLKRPTFDVDERLVLRQLMQRDLLGELQPKGNRILLEDQPDYGERKPVDYDDLPA